MVLTFTDLSKSWGRFFQILCVSQKVRTLTSDFSLHELFSTSRVELVDITNYILASLSTALVLHPFFEWVHVAPAVDSKISGTHCVKCRKKILIIIFFFKFKSPYCMIISFIIQENEIFAYKIIHIPVLSTYVQGKYSSYLVHITSALASISSTYVLDSGHFIDLYIDGHSIEATTR